jgi:hypothetical protein
LSEPQPGPLMDELSKGLEEGRYPPEKLCSAPGCDRPYLANGWCNAHWQRVYRTGDPDLGKPVRELPIQRYLQRPEVCILEGCERPANVSGAARGYCKNHYARFQRHGEVFPGTPIGEFWTNRGLTLCSESGCKNRATRRKPGSSDRVCDSHYKKSRRKSTSKKPTRRKRSRA